MFQPTPFYMGILFISIGIPMFLIGMSANDARQKRYSDDGAGTLFFGLLAVIAGIVFIAAAWI